MWSRWSGDRQARNPGLPIRIITRTYRQQREEETINVDLPAHFIYFMDDEPTWFFAKGTTLKSYYKEHYEDIERIFKKAKPCGNSVYWYDMLDRSSKGSDRTALRIQRISPSCPWRCLPDKRLVLYEPFRMVAWLSKYEITLCIGNTHVLKLFSFDRTSKFWNLQTLTFMHMVRSGEVLRAWIMRGHPFKPRSRVK